MLVLDERHQVHVVISPDNEDTLAGVTVGVWVLQDVEQIAPLDVEDDVLEPDPAVGPELGVLGIVPSKELHHGQRSTMCAHKAHIGVIETVPETVPRRPQERTIQDQREQLKCEKLGRTTRDWVGWISQGQGGFAEVPAFEHQRKKDPSRELPQDPGVNWPGEGRGASADSARRRAPPETTCPPHEAMPTTRAEPCVSLRRKRRLPGGRR